MGFIRGSTVLCESKTRGRTLHLHVSVGLYIVGYTTLYFFMEYRTFCKKKYRMFFTQFPPMYFFAMRSGAHFDESSFFSNPNSTTLEMFFVILFCAFFDCVFKISCGNLHLTAKSCFRNVIRYRNSSLIGRTHLTQSKPLL